MLGLADAALLAWRQNSARPEAQVEDPLGDASTCGVLILDELQEQAPAFFAGRLTQLLDKRYAGLRPTILAANAMPEQLEELIGASAASRLQEVGMVLELAWPSFREP